MSVVADALALARVWDEDSGWRMLRADNAPVIMALLAARFRGEEPRVAADELYDALDHDLDLLREEGFVLPLSGRGYVATWREAGYLSSASTRHRETAPVIVSADPSDLLLVHRACGHLPGGPCMK